MLNLNIKKEELGYLRLLIDLASLDSKKTDESSKPIDNYQPIKADS